jgi:glycosyltransferase involved in cell wall biosynthesis
MFRRSARAAARVVAISNWTKRDIGRFLGHDALEKTRVVYPGTESAFRSIEAEQRNWARNGPGELPPRFIVYAGEISPRKNLTRLLEAVANCSNDTALVLTGHRASRDAQFRRTMEAASRKREIRILGPQPDETLVVLYNLAQASVYPSLYEGFGFPVLESLACGTPVAASNATSIPEAAGDAAVFFDPTDVASITMAIERLLGDPGLRDELRAKGLRRAAQFTWEKSARGVLEVLRETL